MKRGLQVIKMVLILVAIFEMSKCDVQKEFKLSTSNEIELDYFIRKVKAELVFVQGGEFDMGDFGEKKMGVQLDPKLDSKPLHRVEISSFSIAKFKITNRDYHFYLEYNKLPQRSVKKTLQEMWGEFNKTPNTPLLQLIGMKLTSIVPGFQELRVCHTHCQPKRSGSLLPEVEEHLYH